MSCSVLFLSMETECTITNEQINDLPFLVGILQQMGIQQKIDNTIKTHGNWSGISLGTLVMIWLCYLLSERNHQLLPVQNWVRERKHTFEYLLNQPLSDNDCNDDRLSAALDYLGQHPAQEQMDRECASHWMQVYPLPKQVIRLDTTSITVHHQGRDKDSLLQLGYSKDHRPDLPQFKMMLATLDPLGLPLSMEVMAGNTADDGAYLPTYEKTCQVLNTTDLLVVGDSKMSARATRAQIARNQSASLCPASFPGKTKQKALWIEEALAHPEEWQFFEEQDDPQTGEKTYQALLLERTRTQEEVDPLTQEVFTWTERLIITRSTAYQRAQEGRLHQRLAGLEAALALLRQPPKQGRKRFCTAEALQEELDKRIAAAGLAGLVGIPVLPQDGSCGKPGFVPGVLWVESVAWQAHVGRLGWQIYLSNTTAQQYSALAIVSTYRQQITQERGFSRLKNRTLHIRPIYLREEGRIAGLLYLLMLALRFLTLTEYRIRYALAQHQEAIQGLNAASPKSATSRPTTEALLKAFANITLTLIRTPWGERQRHVTPLTPTQLHILRMLELPPEIYQGLGRRNNSPP